MRVLDPLHPVLGPNIPVLNMVTSPPSDSDPKKFTAIGALHGISGPGGTTVVAMIISVSSLIQMPNVQQ